MVQIIKESGTINMFMLVLLSASYSEFRLQSAMEKFLITIILSASYSRARSMSIV